MFSSLALFLDKTQNYISIDIKGMSQTGNIATWIKSLKDSYVAIWIKSLK